MNFPTLETCRAIGAEFPDSEYVYWESKPSNISIHKRDVAPKCAAQRGKRVFAPAPTCEELLKRLGEYFKDKCDPSKSSFEDFNEWHDFSISHVIFEENPAQMLAVELQGILEGGK